MSLAWSFSMYEPAGLARAFGKGNPRVLAELRTLVQDDEEGFRAEDLPVLQELATRLVDKGLSYAGLSEHEASLVDDLVHLSFSPDGLPALGIEPLSSDYVPANVVDDVYEIAPPALRAALAPLRGGGRRADGMPGKCEYVLLSEQECAALAEGLKQLRESASRWPQEWEAELVRECLEEPLTTAVQEKLPVYARLS